MNWLSRLLGLHDKKQQKRTQEIADYVDVKNSELDLQMEIMKKQARKMHQTTRKAYEEAVQLNKIVDGITYKIAVASGGKRRGLK